MFFSKPQSWTFQHGLISRTGQDLWRGVVLALPFWDHGQKIVEDISGNNLHGQFDTGLSAASDWETSTYGSYIDFDAAASEQLFIPPPPAAWLDGTSKLSVEFIFRTNVNTGGVIQGVIGKYTTTVDRRAWRIYVDGDELALQVSSDGAANEIQLTTNANFGVATWYHMVVTYDGGVFKVYKDNIALTTDGDFGSQLSIFAGNTENLRIGARSDSNRLDGGIAGVRIWNGRILTAADVKRLYEDPWEMYEPVFPFSFLPTYAQEHSGGAAAGPWIFVANVAKGFGAYTIESLSNGVSYDVQLRSADLSGNVSAGSTPVAGTPAVGSVDIRLKSILTPRVAKSRPPRHVLAKLGKVR